MRRFIETEKFPSAEISRKAAAEKGPGRPPYWEMVFWWTRKPLITARAIIAASILPETVSPEEFMQIIALTGKVKTPHRVKPRPGRHEELFRKARLLDPFAGFGSIPLEAVRLGVGETVAVELLPTAYIFLKAVLEYPQKYGKQLVRDVERWGKWVVNKLKEDPDIKELYDKDVAVYIGTWETRCPHCSKYTPLVGNWWLARVKKGDKYTRLAYMKPRQGEEGIDIEVVDLNEKHKDLPNTSLDGNTLKIGGEASYEVPSPNMDSRRSQAICLNCGNTIRYIDPETGRHYTETGKLPTQIRNRTEFYVKYALKQWNQRLEEYLEGRISPEELRNSPARPRLLVKVKIVDKDLKFEPTTSKDNEKLWKALRKLKQNWGDPDIPIEPIPGYESRSIWVYPYGFNKWFKLFNPRQLLALVKLVKLIRRAGKKIEEEKLREGWSREEAHRYAEAITTYLAIALVNHVRHNCVVTSIEPTRKFIAHALAFRGIAMTWNWVEEGPIAHILGSYTKSLKSIVDGLSYLVSAVSGSFSSVRVLLDDATVLGKLGDEGFDVIVTDPPYRDDVPYTELSDFYYVWLKRALSDVNYGKLVPRFHGGAFFKRVGDQVFEVSTQWSEFALREISFNPGRFSGNVAKGGRNLKTALSHYRGLLASAFRTMSSVLAEDGVVVTYYNHTSPDAWEELLWAGWRVAGLRVSAVYPLLTESAQSVVRRGKVSLDTSLVVVWRRRSGGGRVSAGEAFKLALEEAKRAARNVWKTHRGLDAFIGVMGRALGVVTGFDEVVFPLPVENVEGRIISEVVFPAAGRGLIEYLAEELDAPIRSREAATYLLAKILTTPTDPRVAGRGLKKRLSGNDVVLLGIASGASPGELVRSGILEERRTASKVEYSLLEPGGVGPQQLAGLLREKGLDPDSPHVSSSVDVLHVMEYYASKYSRDELKSRVEKLRERVSPDMVEEAKSMAKVVVKTMPEGEPEAKLCGRLLEALGELGEGRGNRPAKNQASLLDYMKGWGEAGGR